MKKRSFGWVLLVFVMGITLGGCASMEEYCSNKKAKEEIISQSAPPVAVRQEPPRTYAPTPPPKKDRN